MKNEVLGILKELGTKLEATGAQTFEHLVYYELVSSLCITIFCLLLVGLFGFLAYWVYQDALKKEVYDVFIVTAFAAGVFSLLCFGLIIVEIPDIIAPEAAVLKDLLRG